MYRCTHTQIHMRTNLCQGHEKLHFKHVKTKSKHLQLGYMQRSASRSLYRARIQKHRCTDENLGACELMAQEHNEHLQWIQRQEIQSHSENQIQWQKMERIRRTTENIYGTHHIGSGAIPAARLWQRKRSALVTPLADILLAHIFVLRIIGRALGRLEDL